MELAEGALLQHVRLHHDSEGRPHLSCRRCSARLELDRDGDLPAQMAPFLDVHERPEALGLERCAG